ncbi:SphA family protein [Diaphorobacter caeni]|uniref:SphA family protein n=1 Tax=Diaphorobacter caeni TaxID=2784387 RepID=UPI00188FDEB4|nr:transporter [Diaphorobacter caeni]MBF5005769.1 transporter [Diaphorobacter caeni]
MTTLTSAARPVALSAVAAACALLVCGAAQATEGGGSIYPVGVENYACCALPPPGLYGMAFGQVYSADRVRDNNGNTVTPDGFKVRANVIAPRVVWVTKETVAGASLAFHAIVPLVDLKVTPAPGISQHKTGIGDITFGPALGWHLSDKMHTLLALDIYAPTGDYDKKNIANIGRNYWAVQPVAGFSYMDRSGLNADLKGMYTFNFKNSDTDYRSGQEFIADYSVGWGFGNGFVAGMGGYLYQQVSNDKLHGSTVANNKGRAFAIGPNIKYDSGKGWFVTAKYQMETSVRNRADGKAFWVKAVVPF